MSLDTRGYDNARLLPRSLEDRLLAVIGRASGVCLLAVVALYWAALFSWSVADPSLTYATAKAPGNWLGAMGAIISDLAMQTLGLGAIAALIAPIAWSFELLREGRLVNGRLRIGLYPVAILATAGAVSSLPLVGSWPLHYNFGGALGDGLYNVAYALFALLNEKRAGLAAGLVLIAGAAVVFPKTISLTAAADIKDVAGRAWSMVMTRGDHPQTSAAAYQADLAYVDQAQTAEFSGDDEPSLSIMDSAPAHYADHHGPARDGAGPNASTARRWWPFARRADVRDDVRNGRNDQTLNDHTGQAMSPAMSSFQFPAMAHPSDLHAGNAQMGNAAAWPMAHPAEQPEWQQATPAAFNPHCAAPLGIPHRHDSFDVNTDVASREIAKRFAPQIQPAATAQHAAPSAAQASPNGGTGKQPDARRTSRQSPGAFLFAGGQPGAWRRPSLNLLARQVASKPGADVTPAALGERARMLEDVLGDFGVKGQVKDIRPGPVVTLYELEPARGTKSSRVIGLADDIARSMSVTSVRAAVVPGRNVIGLELPNVRREQVSLRGLLECPAYMQGNAVLPLTLGKGIGGEPIVADLARMPHLLVAGTTGSGKSVGINAMILSLLYRHAPEDCRLLMIDPKMLELSVYNGIPHLLTPVVTDPAQAVTALNWAVREMEERYKRMAALNVRNIDVFNNRVRNALKRGERLGRTVQTGFDAGGQAVYENQPVDMQSMPRIVIVVDEFADLMMTTGKEVEAAVQRLAQMARAAGIHLIMATQRPSVDIITGTIKANFPTRISFKVTTKVDSRTILNEQGAEQLLGQGDMLFSTGAGQTVRVHGPFVSDEEVEAIADDLRRQRAPQYVEGVLDAPPQAGDDAMTDDTNPDDLYGRAVAIVMRDRKASTSYIQRRLSIGYNRAADLIERMERDGLISAADNVGRRTILAPQVDAAE